MIVAQREVAPDRTQFVARDRLFDGQTVFEATHPQARYGKVYFIAPQRGRLAYTQSMTVHHQQEQVIA